MALVPETGSGDNPLANTYATEAQLTEYADARGIELSGNPDQLLLRAMDYAESLVYPGRRTSRNQPLQWPRTSVVLDGYYADGDGIPAQLVRAQIVTALAIDDGRDPMASVGAAVKREKVAELEVEYADGAPANPINVDISRAFAGLLRGGIGGNQIPVYRS